MTTLAASIALAIQASLSSASSLTIAEAPVSYKAGYKLTDGTGANQAKSIYQDRRSLAASASENLDLSGVLTTALGAVINFTKIKAMIFVAADTNVNDVVVGNTASAGCFSFFNATTDAVRVKPGGMVAFVAPDLAGYAVTATTADMLKVLNGGSGTGVTYDVFIIGV